MDVIGPVMIGPSSSHTLGAMRISKFVYNLFNSIPDNVTFYLHGSFKDTYIGHVATKNNITHEVIGSSVGGGRIKIISIDSISCNVTGELPTLVIENEDVPGALESIVRVMSLNSINIAQVSLSRMSKGSKIANMVIELDDELDNSIIETLKMLKVVKSMIYVKPLNC